jgi:hypothetical protein
MVPKFAPSNTAEPQREHTPRKRLAASLTCTVISAPAKSTATLKLSLLVLETRGVYANSYYPEVRPLLANTRLGGSSNGLEEGDACPGPCTDAPLSGPLTCAPRLRSLSTLS